MLIIFSLLSLILSSSPLHAHGSSHDRLHQIQHAINNNPETENARLYIKRGHIHRDAEQWVLAENNYRQALHINPSLHESLYGLAETYLRRKSCQKADATINAYLAHIPTSSLGHIVKAKIAACLSRIESAITHYNKAISLDKKASPTTYIERSKLIQQLKPFRYESLIKSLEDGIKKHGPLVMYIELLVNISIKNNAPLQSKMWINQLPKPLLNTPKWQVKQGDIARLTGDQDTSNRYYNEAIDTINALPAARKNAPAIIELKQVATKSMLQISLDD